MNTNKWFIRLLGITALIIILILFYFSGKHETSLSKRNETVNKNKFSNLSKNALIAYDDSINDAKMVAHNADSVYQIINDSINFSNFKKRCHLSYYMSVLKNQDLLESFSELSDDSRSAYLNKHKNLYSIIKNIQINIFPVYRKKLASIVNDSLWLDNGSASVLGARNEVLRLVDGEFASNRNIQNSFEAIEETLKQYRFKKVEFLWYKDQDDYTYYTLDSPKDSDGFESGY